MTFHDKTDAEILQIIDPIMDNLMAASTVIDHARHTRDFTERVKAIVTPEHLEQVCRKYQAEKGFLRSGSLLRSSGDPARSPWCGDSASLRPKGISWLKFWSSSRGTAIWSIMCSSGRRTKKSGDSLLPSPP
jgi:hypothetical protein